MSASPGDSSAATPTELDALFDGLLQLAAGHGAVEALQIWVADDLGLHPRLQRGRAVLDADRACVRRCCLSSQPERDAQRLALPLVLGDRRSGALLLAGAAAEDGNVAQALGEALVQHRQRLDELLGNQRVARLSGSARHADRLRAALALIHTLEHAEALRPVFAQLHQVLGELMVAENFFVVTLDESRQWLHFEYFVDQYDDDESPIAFHQGRLQGSMSALIVAAGRVLRGSSQELLRQAGHGDTLDDDQFGPRASDWLGVPMIAAGEVIGALVVQSYEPGFRFADADPGVLSMLAEASAAALHRRRLRAALERTVQERTTELAESHRQLQVSLAALQATQRDLLEAEKHASLGRLLSGVAHELNTPIGVAVTTLSHLDHASQTLRTQFGRGQMRRSDFADFLDSNEEGLKLALGSVVRAGNLIARCKQIATPQTLAPAQPWPLADLFDLLLPALARRVEAAGHQLRWHVPPGLILHTRDDVWQSILGELIDNALAHAPRPGQPLTITLDAEAAEQRIDFTLSDDGVGLDPGASAQAFDLFFTTARARGHVGLGLHLVYNLIRQGLGGQLAPLARPAQGFALRWSLPC